MHIQLVTEHSPYKNYCLYVQADRLPEWMHGKLLIASFGYDTEAARYAAEWTQDELASLVSLSQTLWATESSKRRSISSKIEQLKNAVQKRSGIVDT